MRGGIDTPRACGVDEARRKEHDPLMIKLHINAEQLDPLTSGARRCQAAQGASHAATWRYELRILDAGAIVQNVKGERGGYLCDRHLYQALQYQHNEIQAMTHLRATLGLS